MRRDMTSSLRACLAAESWKRLRENNQVATNKGGRGNKTESKNILSFEEFAQSSFKVSSSYAKQALAILNHSPELLEDAKEGLAEAYKTYQARGGGDGGGAKGIEYTFCKWAAKHFKAGEISAKQALAIVNHSPELLEDAKEGL